MISNKDGKTERVNNASIVFESTLLPRAPLAECANVVASDVWYMTFIFLVAEKPNGTARKGPCGLVSQSSSNDVPWLRL